MKATSATSSYSASLETGPVTALTSPSPATDSTVSNTGATVSVTTTTESEADNSKSFQCDKCDFLLLYWLIIFNKSNFVESSLQTAVSPYIYFIW